MSFSIVAFGETLDVNRLISESPLQFHLVHRTGEIRRSKIGRVQIDLGVGEDLSFDEQQEFAIDYLIRNRESLQWLAKFPGVGGFFLTLLHTCLSAENVSGYMVSLSPRLMRLVLEIGLRLDLHVSRRYMESCLTLRKQILDSPAKPLLIGTAILVYPPRDAEDCIDWMNPLFDDVSAALSAAATRVAARFIRCEHPGTIYSRDLSDPAENAARCERCGNWTSDADKPDCIDGLGDGLVKNGRFLCRQCEDWECIEAEERRKTSEQSIR